MSTPKDGGPAFPVLEYEFKASGDLHPSPTMQPGMSLRDYFAAAAVTGVIHGAISAGLTGDDRFTYEAVAARAYATGDQMLKQRGE
jgi:hypothetical protein